jgi:hypothetical protein
MSTQLAQLQEATIKQHCKVLRMPMMGMQSANRPRNIAEPRLTKVK